MQFQINDSFKSQIIDIVMKYVGANELAKANMEIKLKLHIGEVESSSI